MDLNITMKNICLFRSIKMIEHAFDVIILYVGTYTIHKEKIIKVMQVEKPSNQLMV